MIVREKKECCGCRACYEICPVKAIEMKMDDKGFYYPYIAEEKCINCGLCRKVCNNKPVDNDAQNTKYYIARILDEENRKRSRSGGVFWEIASYFITSNGVVYGSSIEENNFVQYIKASTLEECKKLQGSKYVETNNVNLLKSMEADLKDGRRVLFSGTPCQVAGVVSYFEKKGKGLIDNLFTIDIICHGVPSSIIFGDYIKFLEKKYKNKVEKFNFRDKTYGWEGHVESFYIDGKKIVRRNYARLFGRNLGLRPSCGNCQFTSFNRTSDITLGDFWGKKPEGFTDNKGVSNIFINTSKGEQLFRNIEGNLFCLEVKKDDCIQPNLLHPSTIPLINEDFWKEYHEKGILGVLKKYGAYDIKRRIYWKIKDRDKK